MTAYSENRRAAALLAQGALTFAARSAMYGPAYRNFGRVMAGMFPEGLMLKSGDVTAWQRLGVFMQVVNKLCRYATQLAAGGHADSAHDAMVYSAILEELTHDATSSAAGCEAPAGL